jgi:hypothetical protein
MWAFPYTLADGPCDLMVDQEGKVWYSVMGVDSNYQISKIGRLDPITATLTEWLVPTLNASPYYLEMDGNSNCWFVETYSNRIGKVNPNTNIISEYSPLILEWSIAYDLALDGRGNVWYTHGGGCIVKLVNVAGIEEDNEIAKLKMQNAKLFQNSPNPFGEKTTIRYAVVERGYISLKIYDITGGMVRNLFDGIQKPDIYNIFWDGIDNKGKKLPAGVYFCCLKTSGGITETKELVILK